MMNERIKQLMGQTLDKHFSHTWTVMDYSDVSKFAEKFAELIGKDCVSVVQSYRTKMDASNENIVVAIRDHFGIK